MPGSGFGNQHSNLGLTAAGTLRFRPGHACSQGVRAQYVLGANFILSNVSNMKCQCRRSSGEQGSTKKPRGLLEPRIVTIETR